MKQQLKDDIKKFFGDKKKVTILTVVGSVAVVAIAGAVSAMNTGKSNEVAK